MYIYCYHDVIHIPSSTDMLCIVFSRESDSTTPIVHQGCGYIKTRMWLYSKRCGYMSVTKTPNQLKINQIHIPNTTLTDILSYKQYSCLVTIIKTILTTIIINILTNSLNHQCLSFTLPLPSPKHTPSHKPSTTSCTTTIIIF